ncbi:hypothetical protein SK128_018925 [Halocaridina rubra]|uniref:Uncharacterized protein n=1 Tax=Halocaridina rubra TaxID=373956 RepID=A0AAN8XF28_HALRR
MAVGPNGEKLKYSNPRLLVKEFSRSAAGQEILPANIRPLLVLEKTVKTYEHDLADFDPYLNKKTLMETLTIVLSHYRDLDKEEPPEEQSYNYVLSESDIEETWPGEEATDIEDESRAMEEDSDEKKITKDTQTNEKDFNREKTDVCSRLQDLHLQENTDESGPNLSEQSACRSGVTSSVYSVTGDHSRDEVVKVFSDREEAEALYILVNFGSEEAINYTLELPKHIRYEFVTGVISFIDELFMAYSQLPQRSSVILASSAPLPPGIPSSFVDCPEMP